MERVIVYIDGFNLYFGMKGKGWRRYYWLNAHLLAKNLLKPHQRLVETKYFTSRVFSMPNDPGKAKRQGKYLEALSTIPMCRIFYGHYLRKEIRCNKCGHSWTTHEEKMTDVYQDKFDTAFLISGDSELVGPIKAVRRIFPQKRVVIGFPPLRHSLQLEKVANAVFTIGRKKIADSLFPDQIRKADGYILRRPDEWK
ncbi:MAG: NYN domain-containing protein [Desulfobacterales bacterium]